MLSDDKFLANNIDVCKHHKVCTKAEQCTATWGHKYIINIDLCNFVSLSSHWSDCISYSDV